MYTVTNFKTKKALKEAVASGEQVRVWQPGPFAKPIGRYQGTIYLEGPHYPAAHTWYAKADVRDGVIVKGTVK